MRARNDSDSPDLLGGVIPGTPAIHAFALSAPEPSDIPVLIAVPHAGRTYPGNLRSAMRNPDLTALKLEDRYADRLGAAVARETGAWLLVANAPRAMIDLNRAPDDVDWDMFSREDRPGEVDHATSRRARSGLGLIPRRIPGIGEVWKRRHREEDLAGRIAGVHEPYHAALGESLERIRARWGKALLLDLHSMPPIPPRAGTKPAEFVLGDRFGAACHGGLVASAFSYFHEQNRAVAHNRPYSGGYVLQRHGAPESGFHAVQLEVDRSVYLDSRLLRPGGGFAGTVRLLSGLVRRLAADVTALPGKGGETPWEEAAE